MQELQNNAVSANMLTGLSIDEFFQRTDSGGTFDYLSDILGSTVALTGTSGSVQTSYTYGPFGKVSSGGTASSNPYQFTGRENDGTSLDYYRARYFSPSEQRFVSQDLLELGNGETNIYSYAENDPVSMVEPIGINGGIAIPAPPVGIDPPLVIGPILACLLDPLCDAAVLGGAAIGLAAGKLCASRPTQPFRCKLVAEVTNPGNGLTTCGYICKGWGAIATFPLPPDMKSCPKGFDGNFPARNE